MNNSSYSKWVRRELVTYQIFKHLNWIYSAGGNGYINDYPTGRFLRDAKLYEIGAGTSEVRRLVIGRSLNAEYK
jgi:alkylation response protein AidB-like acyl-CoA dehydrogenase